MVRQIFSQSLIVGNSEAHLVDLPETGATQPLIKGLEIVGIQVLMPLAKHMVYHIKGGVKP